MSVKTTMVGYHGTTADSAETILTTKIFHNSTKGSEWLGKGVYFFAYKADAIKWASKEAEKPKNRGKTPAILSAQLEYTPEQMLDLDDPAALNKMHELLQKIGHVIEKSISADCSKLTGPDLWKQWCFNCELYKRIHPEIGIIVYTFRFSKEYLEEFFCANQRQICVSNHDIIRDVSREG